MSKDELRSKLAEIYKCNKDQTMVFGFRTQYGGGKSTGFALIYDSHEALKKFEPHYRLVRIGAATKIEKASRQQRMSMGNATSLTRGRGLSFLLMPPVSYRQTTQEPSQDRPRNRQDEECCRQEGQEVKGGGCRAAVVWLRRRGWVVAACVFTHVAIVVCISRRIGERS